MTTQPPEEEFVYEPADDPEGFEPKPIYTEPNEDFDDA